MEIKYVTIEPWRYVLKVTPNMVTHAKMIDADIESELVYLAHHIEGHDLAPRINRLTRGKCYRWKDRFNEQVKYNHKFKNIPRYAGKAAFLELETSPIWAI